MVANSGYSMVLVTDIANWTFKQVLRRIGVSDQGPRFGAFREDYQVSRAESGSGEPPDRAQICAPPMLMCDPVSNFFFSEPILGPPNVDFGRENEKNDSK